MFLLYSSTITSKEIFAAIGLLSLSMVYMKFCNVCNAQNRFKLLYSVKQVQKSHVYMYLPC